MELRIKHKLFFTLLLTSIVVSGGMFLFMQWNFDRGFLNYVNLQELKEQNLLSERLVRSYSRHGNWNFLRGNPGLWQQLLESGPGSLSNRGPDKFHTPPPRRGPGVALFDAEKKPIFAHQKAGQNLPLHPIRYEESTIGYLAVVPMKELSDVGDLLFVEQQTESFALVAFAMAGLSLLLSFPLTIHLLRPIKALTGGTQKLISGYFKARIPITSGDELGRLSQDFNILADTLEKNEQARQKWVADISHELRTPLAILRGEIEALQDGIRSPSAQSFEALHNEAMHLGRLIDDLYELSMSDIGALNYRKVDVDPAGILQGAVELFESRFIENKIQLDLNLPDTPPKTLSADPDRLQQLFSNLLENSLRYTNSPGQLNIRVKEEKEHLTIYFSDSAPGVPEELQWRLFDRLYRVDASRSRTSGGAGLGMSICKNIVDAHHGEITTETSSYGGLQVRIKLPLFL